MKLVWDNADLLKFQSRLQSTTKLKEAVSKGTKEIARKLHTMLIRYTPVDFGTLKAFWQTEENYAYTIVDKGSSFEITLYNRAQYATWVNDGHRQRPGRFIPGYWSGNHFRYDPNADGGMVLKQSWVQGRFFVEKSIVAVDGKVESLLYKELEKWWEWCVSG